MPEYNKGKIPMSMPFFRKTDQSIPLNLFPVPVFYDNPGFTRFASLSWVGILFLIVCIFILFGFISEPVFLSGRNIKNLFNHSIILCLVSMGALLPFSRGGFDFSIGAVISLSGTLFAVLYNSTQSLFIACIGALGIGLFSGIVNGMVIGLLGMKRLPGFFFTIVSAILLRQISAYLLDGRTIPVLNTPTPLNEWVFAGWFIFIPLAVVLFIWLQIPGFCGSTDDTFGARPVIQRIILYAVPYVVSGTIAAVAGIISIFYVCFATPVMGSDSVTEVFMVLLIGGTWFGARLANAAGTFLAAFFLTMIFNYMMISNVHPQVMYMIRFITVLVIIGIFAGFIAIAGILHRKRS
jgi:ribose/xylose/arabinose/galactoside ABC-type transport system permease subunit